MTAQPAKESCSLKKKRKKRIKKELTARQLEEINDKSYGHRTVSIDYPNDPRIDI